MSAVETFAVEIGGETVAVPTMLYFNQQQLCHPEIRRIRELKVSDGNYDAFDLTQIAVSVVSAALRKVRPDLTTFEIGERLNPAQYPKMREAMWAVLYGSGLYVRVEKKDAATSGEDQAPETPAQSSTETSPAS